MTQIPAPLPESTADQIDALLNEYEQPILVTAKFLSTLADNGEHGLRALVECMEKLELREIGAKGDKQRFLCLPSSALENCEGFTGKKSMVETLVRIGILTDNQLESRPKKNGALYQISLRQLRVFAILANQLVRMLNNRELINQIQSFTTMDKTEESLAPSYTRKGYALITGLRFILIHYFFDSVSVNQLSYIERIGRGRVTSQNKSMFQRLVQLNIYERGIKDNRSYTFNSNHPLVVLIIELLSQLTTEQNGEDYRGMLERDSKTLWWILNSASEV